MMMRSVMWLAMTVLMAGGCGFLLSMVVSAAGDAIYEWPYDKQDATGCAFMALMFLALAVLLGCGAWQTLGIALAPR
jgi:hypothetical protein